MKKIKIKVRKSLHFLCSILQEFHLLLYSVEHRLTPFVLLLDTLTPSYTHANNNTQFVLMPEHCLKFTTNVSLVS